MIDVDFEEIRHGFSSTYKNAQIEIYRTYSSDYRLWVNASLFLLGEVFRAVTDRIGSLSTGVMFTNTIHSILMKRRRLSMR